MIITSIFQYFFVLFLLFICSFNKIAFNGVAIKIVKSIINTIYTLQELYLFSCSFSARVILASFTSSIVSVHSSINLTTNFFPAFTILIV